MLECLFLTLLLRTLRGISFHSIHRLRTLMYLIREICENLRAKKTRINMAKLLADNECIKKSYIGVTKTQSG
jgi:hypothetical protein